MTQSVNDAPLAVEGDVIQPPIWRSWLYVCFGIVSGAVGFGTLGLGALVMSKDRSAGAVLVALGLAVLVIAVVVGVRMGLWQLKDQPRWVIGTDQLQFVERVAIVRLSIPYTNLAAVELCVPGRGLMPFIGLRLVYPELLRFYAGGSPFTPHGIHRRFGYHWRITAAESSIPLSDILEMIQRRLRSWRGGASDSPTSTPAPNPVTDVTSTPTAPLNFTPKNR